jgi:hypothetical protein
MFESISSKEPSSEMPIEYATEVQALELCCQHRSHCLIYNLVGLFKVGQSRKIAACIHSLLHASGYISWLDSLLCFGQWFDKE